MSKLLRNTLFFILALWSIRSFSQSTNKLTANIAITRNGADRTGTLCPGATVSISASLGVINQESLTNVLDDWMYELTGATTFITGPGQQGFSVSNPGNFYNYTTATQYQATYFLLVYVYINDVLYYGGLANDIPSVPVNGSFDLKIDANIFLSYAITRQNGNNVNLPATSTSRKIASYFARIQTYPIPLTQGIFGPTTVTSGGRIELQVPTNEANIYLWSASGGNFTTNTNQTPLALFNAPNTTGDYFINCRISTIQCPNTFTTVGTSIRVVNTKPSTPVLTVNSINSQAIRLRWSPSTDNGSISAYKLYSSSNVSYLGNGTFERLGPLAFAQSFANNIFETTLTGASVNRAIALTSVDNEGLESDMSGEYKFMFDDNSPPTVPASLVLTTSGAGGLFQLQWQNASDFSGIARYNIYYNGTKIESRTENIYDIYRNTLGANLLHGFQVSAVDRFNKESGLSNVVTITMDARPPGIPENVRVTSMTNNSLSVSWDASEDNSGMVPYYTLEISKNNVAITPATLLGLNYQLTDLNPNDRIRLRVSATDPSGNTSANSFTLMRIIDVTPPTIPNSLSTASGSTIRKLSLQWGASVDDNLEGYIIYKDNVPYNEMPITTTSYMVTNVSDLYKSRYSVRAIDVNGNLSGFSNTVTSTPIILAIDETNLAVGVGVNEPTERLEVDENIQITDGSLIFKGSTGKNIVTRGGNLSLQSHTHTGHTLINPMGGNVGIGTSLPGAKLHVGGNVRVDNEISTQSLTVNTVTASRILSTEINAGSVTVNGMLRANSFYAIGINAINVDAQEIKTNLFNTTTLGTLSLGAMVATVSSLINDTVYSKRVNTKYINPYSGNLSIGTAYPPVHKLEVGGNSLFYGDITVAGIKVGTSDLVTNLEPSPWQKVAQIGSPNYYTSSKIGIGGNPLTDKELTVYGNTAINGLLTASSLSILGSNARAWIKGTLHVGFGLGNDAVINGQGAATFSGVTLSNGIGQTAYINDEGDAKVTSIQISSLKGTGNRLTMVNSNGNLLGTIGVSGLAGTGTRMLVADANGNITASNALTVLTGSGTRLVVADAGGNLSAGNVLGGLSGNGIRILVADASGNISAANAIGALAGTGTRMLVADANGNISTQTISTFGTGDVQNTTFTKLQFGTASQNTDPMFIQRVDGESDKTTLRLQIGDASDPNDKLEIGYTQWDTQTWTPKATFYSDGNVVFTNNLKIFGKIAAQEVCINPESNFCDYVFEPDYKLRKLEEVKTFIKANKHLPGVPSAKELKKSGYNVGDMDRYTMEKVEELFLYIIQLENRIRELETKK